MRWPSRSVESFFSMWTPDMAYVLGYFAADGCMYRNPRGSHYIGFTSTDRELILTVIALMHLSNAIEVRRRHPWQKKSYTIQIGSRMLFERLESLGFSSRKSKTLTFPTMPRTMLGHFIRGYFDGDGNVYFRRRNRAKHINYAVTIRFVSGSRSFLASLQKRLVDEGITTGPGSLCTHGPGAYILVYSTKNARQVYSFMYPSSAVPCLRRKREALQQAWKLLGS